MTVAIAKIRSKFTHDAFEFSLHATDQTILRGIRVSETREAIQSGEIIEDYPDDKYGPISSSEVKPCLPKPKKKFL